MAERQFGPYRLVRRIAVGGMAEIHLAKTKGIAGFEKYVALKMIHPNFAEDEQFIQMLVDEAKIAVQLNHGNIAQTFDLGRVGETFYITMEYVDGADLYKILRKGSELDIEMPLDVCAFVGKEVASALDHAHRKRDHSGKSLGIVHRDVSPQNVLISYSGEVKLVDFGIAKATMKARQTAVGVIKGKYYYMSPEQAWGDPIDFRSDIFSAGIVLYEMLTGQMLYLEEDLHKLLDMARRAEIAPPSTLRRGIPPQLERIVMHALAKSPEDRYPSAGDFATDLERFLHAYSPVFTAAKLSGMIKQIVGDPTGVPEHDVELRDGPISTHTLNTEDLIHSPDEIRDENSVIFRVAELDPVQPVRAKTQPPPEAGRVTRQATLDPTAPRPPAVPAIPSIPPPRSASITAIPKIVQPKLPPPAIQPPVEPRPRAQTKQRLAHEETREVEPAPPGPLDDSSIERPVLPASPVLPLPAWDHEHELEGTGERTMITGAPRGIGGGFMMDVATEDGVDATMVNASPPTRDTDELEERETTLGGEDPAETDEDGPTVQRDFRDSAPRITQQRASAVAPALAAKIHAPAVSELRKPRMSRKTPHAGVPQPNILQAIVGSQGSEPMPAPIQSRQASQPLPAPPPTQPEMLPPPPPPGMPQQPYAMQPGYPPPPYPPPYDPNAPPMYPQYPPGYPQHGYPAQTVTPGGLYPFQPYGAPAPRPMTLTGQMRLFEADEMPSMYRVSGSPKWLKLAIAALVAISVTAGVTFFIIRSSRDTPPAVGSVHIESVPPGGEVFYDSVHLAGNTPLTIDNAPVGTRHEIRVELPRHKPYVETVDIPKQGGDVAVSAILKPITGKLIVVTHPDGAEVRIDGQLRGRTPTTINDIDMASAKTLELRLRDYSPYIQALLWPANGEIDIDQKLSR